MKKKALAPFRSEWRGKKTWGGEALLMKGEAPAPTKRSAFRVQLHPASFPFRPDCTRGFSSWGTYPGISLKGLFEGGGRQPKNTHPSSQRCGPAPSRSPLTPPETALNTRPCLNSWVPFCGLQLSDAGFLFIYNSSAFLPSYASPAFLFLFLFQRC